MLPPELSSVSVPHAVLTAWILKGLLTAPEVPLRVLAGDALDALDPELVLAQARIQSLRDRIVELQEDSGRVAQISDLLAQFKPGEAHAATREWVKASAASDVELESTRTALAEAEALVARARRVRHGVPGVEVSAILDLIAALRDPHNRSLAPVLTRSVRDLHFEVEPVRVHDLTTGILHGRGTLLLVDEEISAHVPFSGEYPLPALQQVQRNANLMAHKMRTGQVGERTPLAARIKSSVRDFTLLAHEHGETRRPMTVTQVLEPELMQLSYAVNYPHQRRALPDPAAGTQVRKWMDENATHAWWRNLNVDAWEATGITDLLNVKPMVSSPTGLAHVAEQEAAAWLQGLRTTAAAFHVTPTLALRLAVTHLLAPQRRWRKQVSTNLVWVLARASVHGGVVTPQTFDRDPARRDHAHKVVSGVQGLLDQHSAIAEFVHCSPGHVTVDRCTHCGGLARAILVIPEPVGAVCLSCRRDTDGLIWLSDPYDRWVAEPAIWRSVGFQVVGNYTPSGRGRPQREVS